MHTIHRVSILAAVGFSTFTFASFACAQDSSTTSAQTDSATSVANPSGATTTTPVATSTTTTTSAQMSPDYATPAAQPAPPLATSSAPEETATTEHRFLNRPLFVTGLVAFGGTYAASTIVGAESNNYGDHNYLYYPVVGPWMDIAKRDCTLSTCSNETGANALLIADGVVQGLGALAVVSSFFIPEKTTRRWYLIGNEKLTIAPSHVGVFGYGLGARGSF